ncbi:hypothetical protein INT45_007488 [Circinella minor]|uniref:Arrestin C-terminal-like domain-containing protein n=1 Tax=Circinella minor TaxID=1195481 RepID=A0A8H7SFH0_9FUNG|nr:hypothetical protein INT45_007488 [Circinella minor]
MRHIVPDYSLTIELLPEFGWSTHGEEPTYGPGSVFQGLIRLSLLRQQHVEADSIQIQFQAVESMDSTEINLGVLHGRRHLQPLFAIKHVLWKGQGFDPFSIDSLPFTIQIPVIQYPPSVEKHEYYQCSFKLIAIVEKYGNVLRSAEKKISYRPFIETCAHKRPIDTFSGQIKLHALEYVPGDMITATIKRRFDSQTSSTSTSIKRVITAKLYQISILHSVQDLPKLTKIIASNSWDEERQEDKERGDHLDLLYIPSDVIPSFSYSGFWKTTGKVAEFPLTIGTLGYGIRAPTQLQIYSTIPSQQQQQSSSANEEEQVLPRFMRAVEYSDSLPVYDSARLPSYGDIISTLS